MMSYRSAIILAAGKGERLLPLTEDRPKCLVDVGGTTPLALSLEALHACGVERVVIVTGYMHEYLSAYLDAHLNPGLRSTVSTIYNPQYGTTNNIYSAYLAAEFLRHGTLLLNSDIVYHLDILKAITLSDMPAALVVDPRRGLGREEMKVLTDGTRITRISKQLDPAESCGEYIGIMAVQPSVGDALARSLSQHVAEGRTGEYYEHAIDTILSDVACSMISTNGLPFTEIDTHEDLQVAQRIVAQIRNPR